ncbi:sodium/hydrogen exchanger [Streptomyces albus]|uniref:Sodium/hydrogen exchanger n=1 Tax=Streptomyces albus (strain ATCC 21838 / DSM 41398 / FERM P-419 / JCM 4703 / NBRC 107858) TaxID=1081613 RepID=A0A0B5F969_STRA4|nr:sodium/hydrogen exchanger [Streptomyces albus]AOU81679.1 sodium/hydrogen exchanger [Streptomyces albus]
MTPMNLAVPQDSNVQLVLDVLPALLVILVASILCGKLAVRWGQPRVVGEMVAGITLGPTLFGRLLPDAQQSLFTPSVKPVLYVLSTIGLTLFMFLVGLGLDHEKAPPGHQKTAAILALSSMVPAILLGCGVGLLFHEELSRTDVSPGMFALFVGGALAVTAFPMLARMLYDNGLERSRLGVLALLAAAVDDAVAWCFLAFLVAFHGDGGLFESVRVVVLSAVFAVFVMTVGRRLLRKLGEKVRSRGDLTSGQFHLILMIVLAAGWFTEEIGVYAVFGGFVVGLAMPHEPAFQKAVQRRLLDTVQGLLVPVFFAFSGLNTQIGGLTGAGTLLPLCALLFAAFVGKYSGCVAVMRARGFSWREGSALGSLMNARGLMILIFVNVGLAEGIINEKTFSLLVVVAVVTSASSMPLFKLSLGRHNAPPPTDRYEKSGRVTVTDAAEAGVVER